MTPLKVRPSAKAARAWATTCVWRVVEAAVLEDEANDRAARTAMPRGRHEQEGDLPQRRRERRAVSHAVARARGARESGGNSTVATATENMPCGSM